GVVHRTRRPRRGLGRFRDRTIVELPASQHFFRSPETKRGRSDAPKNQAGFADAAALESDCSADGKYRKVERASAPKFLIRGLPSLRAAQEDFRQELVGLLGKVIDAVISIEVFNGHFPLPEIRGQNRAGAERDQDGNRIGGLDREAARRAGSDPADFAVLLHAEIDGLPPLEALVV